MTKAQLDAGLTVLIETARAIKQLGSVPSGHLYASLMGSLNLDQYNRMIGILKSQGLVKENGHVLTWTGPNK